MKALYKMNARIMQAVPSGQWEKISCFKGRDISHSARNAFICQQEKTFFFLLNSTNQ